MKESICLWNLENIKMLLLKSEDDQQQYT